MNTRQSNLVRVNAMAIADHRGVLAAPASILIDRSIRAPETSDLGTVLAVGSPAAVDSHPACAAANLQTINVPRALLVPGMVNAHTHLDLTHLGPQPHDPGDGFVQWVDMVRNGRRTDAAGIAASVKQGILLSRSAGVVAIADIAGAPRGVGTLAPAQAMLELGMPGTSFLEFFGIGRSTWNFQYWLMEMVAAGLGMGGSGVTIGLQPHAPNTVDGRVYRWIRRYSEALGLPLATHLAETPEERAFVSTGTGPQREMLERLGVWDDVILREVGARRSPIAHLSRLWCDHAANARRFASNVIGVSGPAALECGGRAPLVVHVNDADEAGIETLAKMDVTVVYCPRASAYFGAEAHFGGHRYREMLRAGIQVVLGTDSIVNLPGEAAISPAEHGESVGRGMSIWDEMCFLARRDGTDARQLLGMGTTRAAGAIGLEPRAFEFSAGAPIAGIAVVEEIEGGSTHEWGNGHAVLEGAMRSNSRSQILLN